MECKIVCLSLSHRAKLIFTHRVILLQGSLCPWALIKFSCYVWPFRTHEPGDASISFFPNKGRNAVISHCNYTFLLTVSNGAKVIFMHMWFLQHRCCVCFTSAWPLYKVCEFLPTFPREFITFKNNRHIKNFLSFLVRLKLDCRDTFSPRFFPIKFPRQVSDYLTTVFEM